MNKIDTCNDLWWFQLNRQNIIKGQSKSTIRYLVEILLIRYSFTFSILQTNLADGTCRELDRANLDSACERERVCDINKIELFRLTRKLMVCRILERSMRSDSHVLKCLANCATDMCKDALINVAIYRPSAYINISRSPTETTDDFIIQTRSNFKHLYLINRWLLNLQELTNAKDAGKQLSASAEIIESLLHVVIELISNLLLQTARAAIGLLIICIFQ